MTMKAIFGVLSLLIVLAIVGSLAKKQLQTVNSGRVDKGTSTASPAAGPGSADGARYADPRAMPGATATAPSGPSVSQQSRSMQEQVRADTARALEQGMQRNERAVP
jgi:hypothetical protein